MSSKKKLLNTILIKVLESTIGIWLTYQQGKLLVAKCYYVLLRKETLLYQLSQSDWLWDQRIAIVSTYALIRENQFEDTIKLSKIFIHHPHDLMHKACGWMLREVGKRDKDTLVEFLDRT